MSIFSTISRNNLQAVFKDFDLLKRFEALFKQADGLIPDVVRAQYASPEEAATITIDKDLEFRSPWLVLTPSSALTDLTIKLTKNIDVIDLQKIEVFTTQAITTLTIDGNGATISNAPSTLSAGGFFVLRYDAKNNSWRRIG